MYNIVGVLGFGLIILGSLLLLWGINEWLAIIVLIIGWLLGVVYAKNLRDRRTIKRSGIQKVKSENSRLGRSLLYAGIISIVLLLCCIGLVIAYYVSLPTTSIISDDQMTKPAIPNLSPAIFRNELAFHGYACRDAEWEDNSKRYVWKCDFNYGSTISYIDFKSSSITTIEFIQVSVMDVSEDSKKITTVFLNEIVKLVLKNDNDQQEKATQWVSNSIANYSRDCVRNNFKNIPFKICWDSFTTTLSIGEE